MWSSRSHIQSEGQELPSSSPPRVRVCPSTVTREGHSSPQAWQVSGGHRQGWGGGFWVGAHTLIPCPSLCVCLKSANFWGLSTTMNFLSSPWMTSLTVVVLLMCSCLMASSGR